MITPEDKRLSRQEQLIVAALNTYGILGHEALSAAGFDIGVGESELSRLNLAINRLNAKLPEEDQLIRTSNGSTKVGLLPVFVPANQLRKE